MFLNCPVPKESILCAEDILGPNLGSLKGVTINSCDELPDGMLEEHRKVTLTVNTMNFNGIPYIL